MSAYPLMVDGESLSALVVGGGAVAARKVRGLVTAGARVHVVAPFVCDDIEQLAQASGRVRITAEPYTSVHLEGAMLVVAATNDPAVNEDVARDASDRGLLVNVADAPELGNAVTPAVHRAGDLVVAVTAGGVPNAAARVRDAIAERVDLRYANAVHELARLRRSLLDAGKREAWRAAAADLAGPDFCELVESGSLAARMDRWR